MAKYKCLLPCKINGVWTVEGQVIELNDEGVIKHLSNCDAIEPTKEVRSLTPAEELQKVKPVTPEIAKILVDAGIKTVDKLSAYETKQLIELGLDKKTAEKIHKSFE